MKGLTLNQKEQARLEILNRVLEGRLRASEAARILGVSERHTWRMLAAYRGRELLPWLTAIEAAVQRMQQQKKPGNRSLSWPGRGIPA
ncbi:helix-turn-helix domain-containing protein [Candidatus Bipolaricaulota bacterium]